MGLQGSGYLKNLVQKWHIKLLCMKSSILTKVMREKRTIFGRIVNLIKRHLNCYCTTIFILWNNQIHLCSSSVRGKGGSPFRPPNLSLWHWLVITPSLNWKYFPQSLTCFGRLDNNFNLTLYSIANHKKDSFEHITETLQHIHILAGGGTPI